MAHVSVQVPKRVTCLTACRRSAGLTVNWTDRAYCLAGIVAFWTVVGAKLLEHGAVGQACLAVDVRGRAGRATEGTARTAFIS